MIDFLCRMYFGGIYCILGEISVHFGLVSSDTSLKIGASCGLSSFITFGRWAFKLSNHRETISLQPIVEWEWAFNLFFKLYSISPKAGYNNAVKCWCAIIFRIIVINSFQPKKSTYSSSSSLSSSFGSFCTLRPGEWFEVSLMQNNSELKL